MDINILLNRLKAIVGDNSVTTEEFILQTYTNDFSVSPSVVPLAVVRPGTTEQISNIVKFANENKIPISPRGGGSAQEGGCLAVEGGIVIETLRMDRILKIDEENSTVTVEAGITFGKLMAALEKKGWKIGIAPSGALAGTVGAHLSRPGVGWGNVKYVSQGDQVLGVKAVLPMGDIVSTGTAANPHSEVFFRYALGPDLTGLFIGAEGVYGIVAEATLRMYPYPEEIYLERFSVKGLKDAVSIFREIAIHNLTCFISAPFINSNEIVFDINIEGFKKEVEAKKEEVRKIINKYSDVKFLGSDESLKFWENRWYNTGLEFVDGIAGVINFFLPYSKIELGINEMRILIDKHGVTKYVQQLFPGPTGSEVVALLFHNPSDKEELNKIYSAMEEMMSKALILGGAPYSKGRQWAPFLKEEMEETGYWSMSKTIKMALDPNGIMNPGVIGF